MGAQGSQSGISFLEETEWGVQEAGTFQGVNFVSEDMAFNIENQTSNNVRPDRQTAELVQVGADTAGGFETEFQAKNLDDLLPGFFWAEAWITQPAPVGTADFAIETAPGLGGIITLDAAVVADLVVGQYITFGGATDPANNGRFLIKAKPDTTHIQVRTPLADEAGVTYTLSGEHMNNGVFRHSYSIERTNYDISQFFLYLGMVGNVMTMEIESGSPVAMNLSFVGKDEQLAQVEWGDGPVVQPPTTPIMNAVSSVGTVLIEGDPVAGCLLQKITISLDNQAEGKTGVGTLGFCDVAGRSIMLGGDITLYFNDATYYKKYRDSEAFGLVIPFQDTEGNSYEFYLPKNKFDEMTANVTGKDDDVLLEGTYKSIIGDEGYMIMLSREVA